MTMTTKFRYLGLKREEVEAFQFLDDEHDSLTRAYPRWFMNLLVDQRVMYHKPMTTWFLDKTHPLYNGMWLIRRLDEDGNERVAVSNDEEFKLYYDKVE